MTKREVEEYIMSQIFPNASHEVTAQNVRNAFAPIVERVWTFLEGEIGDLTQLQTVDKQSVVNAINAVLSKMKTDIDKVNADIATLGAKVGELSNTKADKKNTPSQAETDGVDLALCDEQGNVPFQIVNGEIQSQKFNSAKTPSLGNEGKFDLVMSDEQGNVVLVVENGFVKTLNFDSEHLPIPTPTPTILPIDDSYTQKSENAKIHFIKGKNARLVSSEAQPLHIYGKNRIDISTIRVNVNLANKGVVITKADNGIEVDASNIIETSINSNLYAYFDYDAEFDGEMFVGCKGEPISDDGYVYKMAVFDRDVSSTSAFASCNGTGNMKIKFNATQGQRLRFAFYGHRAESQIKSSAKYSDIMIAYYDYSKFEPYTPIDAITSLDDVTEGNIVEFGSNQTLSYYYQAKTHKSNLVCFGDSITGLFEDGSSYPDFISNDSDIKAVNCGFSGSTCADYNAGNASNTNYVPFSLNRLVDAIVSNDYSSQDTKLPLITSKYYDIHLANLKAVDWYKVDYVSILIGTNDWGYDIKQKASDDTSASNKQRTNTESAIRYCIGKLQQKYPHLKIILCSQLPRYDGGKNSDTTPNGNGDYLYSTVETFMQVAKDYNVPFIEFYHNIGMNQANNLWFTIDSIHPNDMCRHIIANNIINAIKKY